MNIVTRTLGVTARRAQICLLVCLSVLIGGLAVPTIVKAAAGDPGSIQFDAATSYLKTTNETSFVPSSSNWTIEGFVKPDSSTGDNRYLLRGYSGVSGNVKEIEIYWGPAFYWAMKGYLNGTETNYLNLLQSSGDKERWYRFIFSQNSTMACGSVSQTNTSTTNSYTWLTTSGAWNCYGSKKLTSTNKITKWVIGSDEAGKPFKGKFANVRISNVARYDLTATKAPLPTEYFAPDDNTLLLLGTSGDSTNTNDVSGKLAVTTVGTVTTSTDYPSLGPATYAVTFDGNGSTGGTSLAVQSSKTAASLSLNTFTKGVESFSGWNTKADGTGVWYSDQGSYPFTSSKTLYAQWRVTATFDKNDGSGATATQLISSGVATALDANAFIRSGYRFDGWNSQADGLGANYLDGQSVTTSGNVTYFAKWVANAYTVTYAPELGTSPISSEDFNVGGDSILLPTPTRSNYQFNGWFTSAVGGTLVGQAEDAYQPTGHVTLHAQWTQSSLVGLSNPTAFGTITAQAGSDGGITATRLGTRVLVDYYADSLPDNTVITAYLQGDKTHATEVLGGNRNVLLSVVVAWKAPDQSVPDVDPTKDPIRVTIINPNIKAGASIYSIIGSTSRLLGTALSDGQASIEIRQDPEIAVVNVSEARSTGSIEFNGDSLLRYPSSTHFDLAGDYTVELWAKYATYPRDGNVILSRWSNESEEYILRATNDQEFAWVHKTSTETVTLRFPRPSLNAWHHIAVVRSGTALGVYVDGVSVSTGTFAGSVVTGHTSNLELGGRNVTTGGNNSTYFVGRLSNVRISNEALYSATFTPSTSALSAVATTSVLLNMAYGVNYAAETVHSSSATVVGAPESHEDVPFPLLVPATPSQVRGTSYVGTTSTITWNGSPDIAGQGSNTYTVYGSNDGTNFSTVTGCVGVSDTTCTATGLVLARGYIFKARAQNASGYSDYSILEAGTTGMFRTGLSNYLPCADQNIRGTSACGPLANPQDYTTAVMPIPTYCDQLDGNSLVWTDPQSQTHQTVLGVFDGDGNMYFVHNNSIRKMSPAGFPSASSCTSTLFSNDPLLKTPSGSSIGIDAAGNIYVSNADPTDTSVVKISADGTVASTFLTTAEVGGTLEGIKFDSDQNLLGFIASGFEGFGTAVLRFSNTVPTVKKKMVVIENPMLNTGGNNTITGFSLNAFDDLMVSLVAGGGEYLVKFDAAFDQGTAPEFCAYSCSTSYYEQLAQWEIYDASGTFYPNNYPSTVHFFARFEDYTWSQAPFVDSEGNVWVPQQLEQRLVKLDPQGKPVLSTSSPLFTGSSIFTSQVKIDPNGNVWVHFGNGASAWGIFPGATKPFLRQLTFKGIGTTPYGTAKSGNIQLDGASGTVAFRTTNSGSVTVSSAGAISAPNTLQPGKYVVSGTALDSQNTSGTWTYTLTVTKDLPTVAVTSNTNPSIFQNEVTLTATPSIFDSGTSVSFYDSATLLGTCIVTSVSCSISTSSLLTGAHSITATIAESAHYLTATSPTFTQTVGQIATSTTWSNSSVPTVGQTITLSASITPTSATGTVVFKDANNNQLCTTSALANGVGSCTWSGNPGVGTYRVTATYSGDVNYYSSVSLAADVVVTAVYRVTFSGGMGETPIDFRTNDAALTLPNPTQAHQIFTGWYDSAVGGTLVKQGGETYTPTASVTLHAYWVNTFAVTYDMNGATSTAPTQDEVGTGRTFVVAATPVRENYLFNGWTLNGPGTLYQPGSTFTMSSQAVTLTARWLSLVHPIMRQTFNNAPGTSWLWNYAGSGEHAGADILPGWCVVAGTDSSPTTWIVTQVTSDAVSNSFKIDNAYTFGGGGYNFSPDPALAITTGATQSIALGSSIATTAVSNTACTANKYVVSPALPNGLSLDPATGAISGQPSGAQGIGSYSVTAQRIVDATGALDLTGSVIGYSSATFTLTVVAPPAVPTDVAVVSGNSQLSVSFTPGSDSGTAITKYQYSTDGGVTWRDKATVVSPVVITTTSDTNATLVNGVSYDVKIRAFSSFAGTATPAVAAVPEVAPDAPANTSITPGNKELSFAFTAGLNAGSAITKYQYSTDGGATWRDASSSSSPLVLTTISGLANSALVNGVSYNVMVRAFNTVAGVATNGLTALPVRSSQSPLSWNLGGTTVAYLGTLTLSATGGSGSGAITYSASPESTCSIAGNVLAPGDAGSTCVVTAKRAQDDTYNETSTSTQAITVTKIDQAATMSFSNAQSMVFGESLLLRAIGGSGNGSISYSISSAGATGCSLTGDTISVAASGTCVVTANRAGSTNYNGTSSVANPRTDAQLSITVYRAAQTVTFSSTVPSTPVAGGSYRVAASASSGLSVSLTVSSGSCTLIDDTVSFGASGDCVITASQTGDSRYLLAQSVTQTVAVGSRNQTLTFSSSTNGIITKTYGDAAFNIEAISNESTAVVAYSLGASTTNSACSVTPLGLVSVRAVGICEVNANAAATSSIAAASTIIKTFEVVSDYANAPYVISSSAGNRSITVTFAPPTYDGGTAVTGYEMVAVDQTNGSTSTIVESGCSPSLTNSQASCTVRGLANGVNYRVKIAAINQMGTGPYSELGEALLAATNPAAVQQLQVAEDNSSLVIRWQDPDSLGGGTFAEYRIYIKRSDVASYDQDHYVSITDNTLHSITVSKESPADGFGYAGGANLVNGVAYDVKVVTVTVANSLELMGNTATANKVPRTVPSAPVLATALVMGSSLVISWAAPSSDGGALINAYGATFGGETCALVNPTDTFCVVQKPSSPGNYAYNVVATNSAGTSTPANGMFTVAAPPADPASPAAGVTPTSPETTEAPQASTTTTIAKTKSKSSPVMLKDLPKTGNNSLPYTWFCMLMFFGCLMLMTSRRLRKYGR